jgi:hypothetical protein
MLFNNLAIPFLHLEDFMIEITYLVRPHGKQLMGDASKTFMDQLLPDYVSQLLLWSLPAAEKPPTSATLPRKHG